MLSFFLSLIPIAISLLADVTDHLKPVTNKSPFSRMDNIDYIYMINLDERPEKYESCMNKLKPFNITPCRFSAINGWKLAPEAILDVGVQYESWMSSGKWGTAYRINERGELIHEHEILGIPGTTYFCHCMAPGAVGCALSHLSVLQDALDSGYQTVWIMEDDIEIVQNPHLLSQLIQELDDILGENGWDVLFTDPDSKNSIGDYVPCSSYAWKPNYSPFNTHRFAERRDIGDHFRQIGSRYGSYSMIVRRSGIRKILNFFKCYQIFLPYDMEYTQPENIRLFTVKQDIVSTQPNAASDNGAPNYLN